MGRRDLCLARNLYDPARHLAPAMRSLGLSDRNPSAGSAACTVVHCACAWGHLVGVPLAGPVGPPARPAIACAGCSRIGRIGGPRSANPVAASHHGNPPLSFATITFYRRHSDLRALTSDHDGGIDRLADGPATPCAAARSASAINRRGGDSLRSSACRLP